MSYVTMERHGYLCLLIADMDGTDQALKIHSKLKHNLRLLVFSNPVHIIQITEPMSPQVEAKAMFWNTINVAGTMNSLILTEQEIAAGQLLLTELRESLLQLKSEHSIPSEITRSQRKVLSDKISRASVAIAPHKRLPREILAEVFRSCLPPNPPMTELPPSDAQLLQAPWVLGQICRSWRQLSRSIAELWGTVTIRFDGFDDKKILKLRCASELLPDVALINVEVSDGQALPVSEIRQSLSRISALDWRVKRNDGSGLIEQSSPEAFGNLISLHVEIEYSDDKTGNYVENLFGKSSKLEHFTLTSDTPSLLLTDIPWPQLRSFSLHFPHVNISSLATWGKLAYFNPFRSMSSLGTLSLDLPDESLLLILAYGFPWHQLKSLELSWKNSAYDFRPLVQTLQKCISLVELKLYHSTIVRKCPLKAMVPVVDYTVAPFSLTRLLVERLPASLTKYLCSSGELQDLYTATSPITLPEFHDIVQQCPCLRRIFSVINTADNVPSSTSTNIMLPNLTHLTLIVDDIASYPTLLTPALTFLLVSTVKGADLVDIISHSISRSEMHLEGFTLISWPLYSTRGNLLHLLSTLASCTSVHMIGLTQSHEALESIASCRALPHVSDLEVTVSEPGDFTDMIQKRLRNKSASGYVGSQKICGYSVAGRVEAEQTSLEGLAKQYGVTCTLRYFGSP